MSVEVVGTQRFKDQMLRYAAIYGPRHDKGLGEIMLERAKKLTFQLYKETKRVAPTSSDIASDVVRQGWKIPTKFPDGRLGRGTSDQWKGNAIAALPKRRGRKSKARIAQEDAISRGKATLAMMQAFVIKKRSAAIGYVAKGWLAALDSLEGAGGDRHRGRAVFSEGFFGIHGTLDIINSTPGIASVNAKHGVVEAAIEQQTADMAQYVADHIGQQLKAA